MMKYLLRRLVGPALVSSATPAKSRGKESMTYAGGSGKQDLTLVVSGTKFTGRLFKAAITK